MDHYPSTRDLEGLDVLIQGQSDDCHIDTGDYRIWLSRTGIMDGEPYKNTVTVEENIDGRWSEFHVYDGDNPPDVIPGLTPHIFQGEY